MDKWDGMLLFVFLLFVLTAYMVLLRDIWTPLVNDNRGIFPTLHGDLALLAILLLVSPFLVQRTLHALRFNCYTGFGAVSMLGVALVHHAWRKMLVDDDDSSAAFPIQWFPERWADVLFAFPIIMLSFLATFNVLPIQNALVQPTRQRTRSVIRMAVGACFVLMYGFGLGGYLFARAATQGNILLNCMSRDDDSIDWMFLLGRIGCGITIMLALAMMMLPCRDSLLEAVGDLMMVSSSTTEASPDTMAGEGTSLLRASSHGPGDAARLPHARTTAIAFSLLDNPLVHYGSTLAIALLCYLGAVVAPGVAVVWSLCGSSMAFLIAFLLPAACYVELERKKGRAALPWTYWNMFSWFLIAFSIVGGTACTWQTILMLG
jgi:hypothetical protein